jgi:hypothetical protein
VSQVCMRGLSWRLPAAEWSAAVLKWPTCAAIPRGCKPGSCLGASRACDCVVLVPSFGVSIVGRLEQCAPHFGSTADSDMAGRLIHPFVVILVGGFSSRVAALCATRVCTTCLLGCRLYGLVLLWTLLALDSSIALWRVASCRDAVITLFWPRRWWASAGALCTLVIRPVLCCSLGGSDWRAGFTPCTIACVY